MNQIFSFLTKKSKSQGYFQKLSKKHDHQENWHLGRFYQYMIRIKDDTSHYVDEKVLNQFFEIKDPSGSVY